MARGRVGLVLLALGPVLAAAYAVVNHAAIRLASKAQVGGPEWEGGRVGADGMTALGVDSWRLVSWTSLLVGALAVAYVVIGVLLRRRSRGRAFLLVSSGVLIVPYALAFLVALLNPVRILAGLYDSPDFAAGIPSWQPAAALIPLAGGLAQAAGLAVVAGRRAKLGEESTPVTS
ncbi:hypothetical protein ITP53_16390 [Nonomuraea sp. K274]|uniref:Uncharacterized protein n=1 Tax=Nonomuraea cypriaca TaxID=1187855 RepID=A0A931F1B8_9ACTN|nr:hypothetical protein [Nonomuraea cypriaca]MBF8187283.1 hypothetical protein [Nonomuraea cypriaca]